MITGTSARLNFCITRISKSATKLTKSPVHTPTFFMPKLWDIISSHALNIHKNVAYVAI